MKTVFENENGIIKVDDFGAYIINAKNGSFEVANNLEKAIRILEKISKQILRREIKWYYILLVEVLHR